MNTSDSLSQTFLEHAGSDATKPPADPSDLEAALADVLARAEQAWPALRIPRTDFLHHLAARRPADVPPLEYLLGVHAVDLYLAFACARGQPDALRAFEEQYMSRIEVHDRKIGVSGATDEVRASLRERLLVATENAPARIGGYSGQGPLAAWLRMAAVRQGWDLQRKQKEFLLLDGERPLQVESNVVDLEIEFLKRKYGPELEEAFRTTLATLTTRERTILKMHFIDGMQPRAIAPIYRVSTRTLQRWIAEAIERIKDQTRRLLAEKLGERHSQIDTLLNLVQSQVDVSVHDYLDD